MEKEKFNINGATEAEIKVHCLNIVATHYNGFAGVAIDDIIQETKKLYSFLKAE